MVPFETTYTLSAVAPTEVDRFAVLNYIPSGRDSALSLPRKVGASSPHTIGKSVVHPEGSLIYSNDKLVSCQPITSAHISLGLHIISQCGESVAEATATVFVELRDRSQANYYVVAHASKAILWIDGQMPGSFSGATPSKHEHEYWIHMENFPGPCYSTPGDRQTLMNVMASTSVDAATSDGSTSPMSVQQIETNLKMLDSFGSEVDIHQTYAIGPLLRSIRYCHD
jgi:hypothetical protein